jgi:hypothetical protein
VKSLIPLLILSSLPFSLRGEAVAGYHWPTDQLLPSFAAPRFLDVADLLESPGDVRLLMATLQGVINRSEPRIYLLENVEEGKETWLRELEVPYKTAESPWQVFEKYLPEIKGLVIYDPAMADTVNVATTLAGLHDAVVASPELAEKLAAAPYRLPIIDDLRGKFSSRLEAYSWQYENLRQNTTNRMLVGLSPGRSIPVSSRLPEHFNILAADETRERRSRNRGVREIDLSAHAGHEAIYLRFDDAFPDDGWGPAVGQITIAADGVSIADFSPGTEEELKFLHDPHNSQLSKDARSFRFADHRSFFVYRFPIPQGAKKVTASIMVWNQFRISSSHLSPRSSREWRPYGYLRDYAVANKAMVFWLDANTPGERELFEKILSQSDGPTPYLGWFGNDIEGEFSAVELASRHGVFVVPADWFNNLTVFSGTRPRQILEKRSPAPVLENKIYVTCTFGEGDNFQYNQHRMRIMWEDPARGKIPLNWTSSPLLIDGAPAILDHYRRTATENDCLVAGPSGVGYFYPSPWDEKNFSGFLESTRSYATRSGLHIPYVLNRSDHKNLPLSDAQAAAYREAYGAPGVLLGWDEKFDLAFFEEDFPVSTIHGVSTVEQGVSALKSAETQWDGNSPLFLSVGLFAWNLRPSDVVKLAETVGGNFRFVRADDYFSLLRQSRAVPSSDPQE